MPLKHVVISLFCYLLFRLLLAIFYLFHTPPQAKYSFHFFLSEKLDPKLGLVLMWGLRRRTKRGFTHFKCHLLMPSQASLNFLGGSLNVYLQHVLGTLLNIS